VVAVVTALVAAAVPLWLPPDGGAPAGDLVLSLNGSAI
jgi:hypothetical protein